MDDDTVVFHLHYPPCWYDIIGYTNKGIPKYGPIEIDDTKYEDFEVDDKGRFVLNIGGVTILLNKSDLNGYCEQDTQIQYTYVARIQSILKQIYKTDKLQWSIFLKAWNLRSCQPKLSKVYDIFRFSIQERNENEPSPPKEVPEKLKDFPEIKIRLKKKTTKNNKKDEFEKCFEFLNMRIDKLIELTKKCQRIDENDEYFEFDYITLSYFHLFNIFIGGSKTLVVGDKFVSPNIICLYGSLLWWGLHIAFPSWSIHYTKNICMHHSKVIPIEMHPESFVFDFVNNYAISFTFFHNAMKKMSVDEKEATNYFYRLPQEEYYFVLLNWNKKDDNQIRKCYHLTAKQMEIGRLVLTHELNIDFHPKENIKKTVKKTVKKQI